MTQPLILIFDDLKHLSKKQKENLRKLLELDETEKLTGTQQVPRNDFKQFFVTWIKPNLILNQETKSINDKIIFRLYQEWLRLKSGALEITFDINYEDFKDNLYILYDNNEYNLISVNTQLTAKTQIGFNWDNSNALYSDIHLTKEELNADNYYLSTQIPDLTKYTKDLKTGMYFPL